MTGSPLPGIEGLPHAHHHLEEGKWRRNREKCTSNRRNRPFSLEDRPFNSWTRIVGVVPRSMRSGDCPFIRESCPSR